VRQASYCSFAVNESDFNPMLHVFLLELSLHQLFLLKGLKDFCCRKNRYGTVAGLEPEPGGPHRGVQGHTHQQDRQEEGQQDSQLLQALLPGRSQGSIVLGNHDLRKVNVYLFVLFKNIKGSDQ
jgi:hypothetical protein